MLSKLVEEKGEFELKYTFPNHCKAALESWLLVSYKKDQSYPESRVQSIYLETNFFESYQEKANSDFFKTKYRVRWYENGKGKPFVPGDNITVYLENKMKIGTKRLKNRWIAETSFDTLKSNNLNTHFHGIWYEMFSNKKKEVIPYLQPYIQISYTRKRFVDSMTGARLSLDYDIRVEKTNSTLLPPPQIIPLDLGVVEVKSQSNYPPHSLAYLTTNLAQKANFSKYEQCVSSLEI